MPADRLKVPATIDQIHAAPLSCALGTAYRSVVVRGGVRPGSRVAVIGLGGVGIHAAQIARAAGADVVGLDIHEPTLAAADDLGDWTPGGRAIRPPRLDCRTDSARGSTSSSMPSGTR